jgi:MFS family permease
VTKLSFGVNYGTTFRAFRYRNFRLFSLGQSISLIGTWAQLAALSWLVYRLTGSTFLLGTVAFLNQIPMFLLGPFAGVAADRANRKRMLIWIQGLSMIQALILASLVLTDALMPWHIITLSLFIGVINAYDLPIRQSFLIEMVEGRQDLGNAIALNAAIINIARFIGPPVAGFLISTWGEGICFLVNGVSYLPVIASLFIIRVAERKYPVHRDSLWSEFSEAIRYVWNSKPIIAILGLILVHSIAGSPYQVLMPAYAKDILCGNANTFGWLMASPGIGALLATLFLAGRRSVHGFIWFIPASAGMFGISVAVFGLSRSFSLSFFFLFIAGFSMMIQAASSNTLLQTIVEENKRGRIMSLWSMFFWGAMPFGSILSGSISVKIGVQNTLLIGAGCCVVGAVVFASKLRTLTEQLRPIIFRSDTRDKGK